MKKKKGKRVKSVDGEIPLPEAMIQHIQSFLSRKEAAATTILSKSWHNAWLTRPVLDFDTRDFNRFYPESNHLFEEFVNKTMQRYQNLSLKIDSFRLDSCGSRSWGHDLIASILNLIVGALKMGATTVQLEDCSFTLPQEVLGSETLLNLSLSSCKVDGNYIIRCSSLKSLTLERVDGADFVKDLISHCISMEELSLSNCYGLRMNQFEFHKLRLLFLERVDVGSIFSSNFSSRFPFLKDLSILQCRGCMNIQIASTSLETICFKTDRDHVSDAAKFDAPKIRKFTYTCFGLPSHLSINGASKEWEFDVCILSNRFLKTSWFINLKKLLKKFSLSRISLSICLYSTSRRWKSDCEHEVDVEVVPNILVLEQLIINAPHPFSYTLVLRSLGAFRPKFITHPHGMCYAWILDKVKSVYIFRKRLIEDLFISNWEDMFGQFGLKKVNVEIYDKLDALWRPPQLKKAKADSKAKVRLQLIWED